ncbi:hypothetical protein CRG98_024949 [Punica granatum]|uniref:Uncharacterized protein n=1 Tax=Punica granatum TaxID=22663 RepID=A0A2I0JEK7_PUNGR|nr:hypothetical protein CRG98_024949 [Punica granatum]
MHASPEKKRLRAHSPLTERTSPFMAEPRPCMPSPIRRSILRADGCRSGPYLSPIHPSILSYPAVSGCLLLAVAAAAAAASSRIRSSFFFFFVNCSHAMPIAS